MVFIISLILLGTSLYLIFLIVSLGGFPKIISCFSQLYILRRQMIFAPALQQDKLSLHQVLNSLLKLFWQLIRLECRSKRDYGQKVNRALSRHFFELLLFSKNHLLKSFLSDFFEGIHIKPWTIFVSRS